MSGKGKRRLTTKSPYRGDAEWYWERRNDLFDRFDEGICFDEEGLYSIKPKDIAREIVLMFPGKTVIDAFGGLGGISVALAQAGKAVDAIEIVRTRAAMLRANLMFYGLLERVRVHDGDAFELVPHMRADALYLDPPWGGPPILRRSKVGLELFPPILPEFIRRMRKQFCTVGISFPPNFDFSQMPQDLCPRQLLTGSMWGRKVVITGFYGP